MKIKKVYEVMIPLSEYATVNENDTLKTAISLILSMSFLFKGKMYIEPKYSYTQ